MPEMVEVIIDSIRVSLLNQQRIVILRELDVERYLAIWIGIYEAEHLTMALQDVAASRPLTYDLMIKMVKELDASIARVEVVALRDETFYGNIVLRLHDQEMNIDARPSDAMNLAIRSGVPIYVALEVMESAGITPEEDAVAMDAADADIVAESADEKDDERLSIFEDFLDKLNLDDTEDESPEN
ncbi:MAG: bifunctional nuclease family protein [Anaerolineae bacterium]|nr:bifunctional nuclease family protein [Chloroflexota bacterium]MBT7069595.1 bifunctional nuclease family protein [Anaerolineae bacterium]